MRNFPQRNRTGVFFYALVTFAAVVVNAWFGVAVALGIVARVYSGHVISVVAGLAVGVILVELARLALR